MKLRFEKNTLRYRLRKSDLEQLNQHGFVKDTVAFPSDNFQYELRIAEVPDITADIHQNFISVQLPVTVANTWINTEEVGIYQSISIAGQVLNIIIEKDFPCKDREEEDKSDTFTELVSQPGNKAC